MSLIIYSKDNNNREYGVKKISNILFKKLMYNEIHKKCRFSIPKENLTKEFGITFDNNNIDLEEEHKYEFEPETNISNLDFKPEENSTYDLDVNTEEKLSNIEHNLNVDVLMMTQLDEKKLETYLEIYQDNEDNLNKFIEFFTIISYNQISLDKFKIKKKLNQLLCSLSEYWEDPAHCYYTLTDKFNKRKFNNVNYNGFDENVIKNINSNFEINWNSREINYLNDIIKFNDWKEMCLHKYYMPIKSEFTPDDIVQIYKQLPSEYLKYMFISNMLVSRTHCHLILNNKQFLELSKPLLDKYKLIFKYLIGYTWITLKNEEYHIYHKIKDTDRIVFDIDTAELLPSFPFSYDDINQNPYACLLIDKNILDIKNNCLTMEMMRDYTKYYGVCGKKEFERRLNIFVNNGTNTKGILECVDWSSCVITGSVMTACGMKHNPLIDICKTDNNMDVITDGDLSNYYFHYYANSDIDMICNKKSIYDYIQVVNTFISKTTQKYNKISISNIHTGTMILSDEFILGELDEINKILKKKYVDTDINVGFIKSNFANPEIKKYFYSKYYLVWKQEQKDYLIGQNINIDDGLIKDYLIPIPEEEFRLYNLDYELDTDKYPVQDYEKYFYSPNPTLNTKSKQIVAKLSESIRFKVSNPYTKTFEIFKSRDENFFSIVSKFHMGFVRAFWNGQTVLCLPSYITSLMLQLAVDYKYFASIRDPIEIVNKYRSRGFGIVLNRYEKLHMAYYNSSIIKNKDSTELNKNWVKMYNINIKSKYSVENIFGVKKSSNEIFKPSKYFIGIPDDCFKNINHDTVSSFDECFSSLITQDLKELAKFKAIGDNGKINPLDRNVIDLGWKLLNK